MHKMLFGMFLLYNIHIKSLHTQYLNDIVVCAKMTIYFKDMGETYEKEIIDCIYSGHHYGACRLSKGFTD